MERRAKKKISSQSRMERGLRIIWNPPQKYQWDRGGSRPRPRICWRFFLLTLNLLFSYIPFTKKFLEAGGGPLSDIGVTGEIQSGKGSDFEGPNARHKA